MIGLRLAGRLFFGLVMCSLPSTLAQARTSIVVSPVRLVFEVEPGNSETQSIRVYNKGDGLLTVHPELWDWGINEAGTRVTIPPGASKSSIVPWALVTPRELSVPSGGAETFQIMISTPDGAYGARQGMLYVVLGAADGPGKGGDSGTLGVGARIGAQILVDTETERATVVGRIVDVQPPTSHRPFRLTLEVANTGAVHAGLKTSVELVGPFEEFIAHVEGEESAILVLPGEKKELSFQWAGALPPARYSALAVIHYNKGQFAVAEHGFEVAEQANVAPVSEIIESTAQEAN